MPEQPPKGQIIMSPEMAGGVWSNSARVSHSPYEFTLDFVRLDFHTNPPNGVVVARVNMSPLMVSQLIDALQTNWARYAEKAMPQEVYRNDSDGDSGQPAE